MRRLVWVPCMPARSQNHTNGITGGITNRIIFAAIWCTGDLGYTVLSSTTMIP